MSKPTSIDESFWKNSPSPAPDDERGEDGMEWSFEVVGEEIDSNGEVRYEIEWDNWQRADGTSQTWQRMHPFQLKDWQRMQKRERNSILKDSIDITLEPLSGTDIHNDLTRLRAQAYQEKLEARRQYSPKLEEQMAKLLAEKLGPGSSLKHSQSSPTSAGAPGTPGRGLRLSTVRQHQQQQAPTHHARPELRSSPSKPQSFSVPEPTASISTILTLSTGSSSKPLSRRRDLPRPSSSKSSPVSPGPSPREHACRKRKASETEGMGDGSGPSREDHEVSMSVGKGKAPMRSSYQRLQISLQWTKIAGAAGAATVSFVNDVDDEEIPSLASDFQYLEKGYIYPDHIEKPSTDFQIGCDCTRCDSVSQCDCQSDSEVVNKKGRKAFAYTKAGLFSFSTPRGVEVIECNAACHCAPDCNNRVAQRPRDIPLVIFKTEGKGWGVRATIDIIRGKVLGMYSGQLITREEALKMDNSTGGYIFDLDGQEDLGERGDEDGGNEGKFSVDSRTCGNWTHFVNHSCTPNMSIYLVVYDTLPATNRPYVTFVARESIKAGTELTVDYDPASADPHNAINFTAGDVEGMRKCFCASGGCRDYVRMF